VEESGRFLKKAAQKLFYAGPRALAAPTPAAQHQTVLLADIDVNISN
jgi:hypothetical protein